MRKMVRCLLYSLSFFCCTISIAATSHEEFDYEEMFENHNSIMLIINSSTGAIHYANAAAIAFYGYEDLLSMNIDEINTLTKEEIIKEMENAVEESRNYFIFRHRLASGAIRTVEVRSYPFEHNGDIYLYSIINDRTHVVALEWRNRILIGFALIILTALLGVYSYANYALMKKNKEIDESKKRMELVLDVSKNGYWDWNLITDEAFFNKEYYTMLGYEPGDFTMHKDSWVKLLHPEDIEVIVPKIMDKVGRKEPYVEVFRMLAKDGSWKWIESQGQTYEDDKDGNPTRVVGIHIDISERVEFEEKLKHANEMLKYVIEHSKGAIAVHDLDLRYVYVSDSYFEQYHLIDKDIIGKHHYDVFPEVPEKWRKVHQEALQGIVNSSMKDEFIRADGTKQWTRWEVRPWYDYKGEISGIIVYTEVIDLQIELELELERRIQEQFLQRKGIEATLMAIADGVITTDQNGLIKTCNIAAEKLTGWSQQGARGKKFCEIFRAVDETTRNPVDCIVQKTVTWKKQTPLQNHTILINKEGQEYFIESVASPIPNENGEIVGVVIIFRDTTSQIIARKEIDESEKKYRDLVTQMPLGMATHELIYDDNKNPIDYRFISVNDSFEKMTGLKRESILNKTVLEVLPTTEDYWIETYAKVVQTKESITIQNFSKELGKFFRVTAYAVLKNHFTTIVEDITEEISLYHQINLERQRLSRVVDSTTDIIFEIDTNKCYQSIYGKGLYKLNQSANFYVGKTVLEVFGEEGVERDRMYSEALRGKTLDYEWSYRGEGKEVHFESMIAPMYDDEKNIIGAVGIARDVSEKKQKQDEIMYLSYHDQLTNVYNRRYYEMELHRIDQKYYYPLSLAIIDLNGLKIINDAFGHKAGDIALQKIAKVITSNTRYNDIVARVGGDEFVLLMPNTITKEAKEILERIHSETELEMVESLHLSISYGVHTKMTEEEEIAEIFRIAEDNMYNQKLAESSSMRKKTIDVIMQTLFEKNEREEKHCERVSDFCVKIGRKAGLSTSELSQLRLVGVLHDIGKIVIDENILNKPGKLTDDEWVEIKRHPEVGYRILSSISEFAPLANVVLTHHERWDGLGYPRGLSGEAIPLMSRIIAVADAFDAMTVSRPYRDALTTKQAVEELQAHRGTQFDPRIVDVFLDILSDENDLGISDVRRLEKLQQDILAISKGGESLFPKKYGDLTSVNQFLKTHGFSGYVMKFNGNQYLYFGYNSYIRLRKMNKGEETLPWQILQPYNSSEEPSSNVGVYLGGQISTINPRGTGAMYHNVTNAVIFVQSKHLYGYQGDLWGVSRYGVIKVDKTGTILENYHSEDLAKGIVIQLNPGEYLITSFEADRIALGGSEKSFAMNPAFQKGQKVEISFHKNLIYYTNYIDV